MQKSDLLIQNTIVMTNYETVQMGMDIAVAKRIGVGCKTDHLDAGYAAVREQIDTRKNKTVCTACRLGNDSIRHDGICRRRQLLHGCGGRSL